MDVAARRPAPRASLDLEFQQDKPLEAEPQQRFAAPCRREVRDEGSIAGRELLAVEFDVIGQRWTADLLLALDQEAQVDRWRDAAVAAGLEHGERRHERPL